MNLMTTVRAETPALSLPRLYLLRFGYLVLGVGLAVTKWPLFVHHEPWTLYQGVVNCMLLALSVLALIGVRHPVRMLPVLLFESAWKLIWLAVVALPLWTAGSLDGATGETAFTCLWVVIILAAVPWPHVWARFVTERGERWR